MSKQKTVRISDEDRSVFDQLLASLMGDASGLQALGNDYIDPTMVPDGLRNHKGVLQALYDADAKNIAPLPANLKLLTEPVLHPFIDQLAALQPDMRMIRARAIWVKSWIMNHHLDLAYEQVSKLAGARFGDATEKRDLMLEALMDALPADVNLQHFTRRELSQYLERIQAERVTRRKAGLPLGAAFPFVGLQTLTPILRPGEMTLFVAPTGTGKTLMGMEFARFNTEQQDVDVLWLLTETTPDVVEQRFTAQALKLPSWYVENGIVDFSVEPWAGLRQAYNQKLEDIWNTGGRLHVEYVYGKRAHELQATIRFHKKVADKRNRPLLVIIDYLQDIAALEYGEGVKPIEQTAQTIKRIAGQENVHIVLFSQQSFASKGTEGPRSHGGNMPQMKAQVMVVMERNVATETVLMQDNEGNTLLNAMGKERHWQIADGKSYATVTRLSVVKSNNSGAGHVYIAIETPLFACHDISGAEWFRLPDFMQKQIRAFEERTD
jgi:replicative DNA helicase